MAKTNIVSLINSRIIEELAELEGQKSYKIKILHEDMARRGQLNGTPSILRVKSFCSEEIKEATDLICKTINEFINTSGERLSEELSAELKEKIKDKFETIGEYERRYPKIDINASPTLTSQYKAAESEINNERSRSIDKINTEIDLLLLKQQKIQADNKNESKANDSSQVPENPLQAFIHFIWPPTTIWKKVVLGILIILVACFAVWSTLPDEIKKNIIHVFWHKVEKNKVSPLIVPKR